MQDYIVKDKNGTELVMTGNRPPNNQQIKNAFRKYYDSQASSEIPPLEGISEAQLRSRPREQESFGDMARGVGEVALETITSIPKGIASIPATAVAIGQTALEGDLGTARGARELGGKVQELTSGLDPLIYQPKTRTGQELSETLGRVASNIPPVLGPVASNLKLASSSDFAALDNQIKKYQRKKQLKEVQVFNPDGSITPEAQNIVKRANQENDAEMQFTPEMVENYNVFVQYGITPTRANVTQSIDDKSDQKDALKRTGPVAERVAEQQRRQRKIFEERRDALAEDGDGTDIRTGEIVFKAIDDFADAAENSINAAYDVARNRGAIEGRAITLEPLAIAVKSQMGKDRQSGGVVSAVETELLNEGILIRNADGKVVPNQGLARNITVDQAESIRKYLNRLFDSSKGNKGATDLINLFKRLIDESVENAVGKDIFKEARRLNTDYKKTIERTRKSRRDKSKKNLLEDILQSKVEPDQISKRLTNAGIDDFKGVMNFLRSDESGALGDQAIKNIKANFLNKMLDKITLKGSTVMGEPEISFTKMDDFVRELRRTGKYNQIFDAGERTFIDDMLRIAKAMSTDKAIQSGTGPSGKAIARLLEYIAFSKIPGINVIAPIASEKLGELRAYLTRSATDKRLLNVPEGFEEFVRNPKN
tara:strand:+ start:1645 stop:3606 length:1962 start_codon:yes stop_codon:yes gene_type:complete